MRQGILLLGFISFVSFGLSAIGGLLALLCGWFGLSQGAMLLGLAVGILGAGFLLLMAFVSWQTGRAEMVTAVQEGLVIILVPAGFGCGFTPLYGFWPAVGLGGLLGVLALFVPPSLLWFSKWLRHTKLGASTE